MTDLPFQRAILPTSPAQVCPKQPRDKGSDQPERVTQILEKVQQAGHEDGAMAVTRPRVGVAPPRQSVTTKRDRPAAVRPPGRSSPDAVPLGAASSAETELPRFQLARVPTTADPPAARGRRAPCRDILVGHHRGTVTRRRADQSGDADRRRRATPCGCGRVDDENGSPGDDLQPPGTVTDADPSARRPRVERPQEIDGHRDREGGVRALVGGRRWAGRVVDRLALPRHDRQSRRGRHTPTSRPRNSAPARRRRKAASHQWLSRRDAEDRVTALDDGHLLGEDRLARAAEDVGVLRPDVRQHDDRGGTTLVAIETPPARPRWPPLHALGGQRQERRRIEHLELRRLTRPGRKVRGRGAAPDDGRPEAPARPPAPRRRGPVGGPDDVGSRG